MRDSETLFVFAEPASVTRCPRPGRSLGLKRVAVFLSSSVSHVEQGAHPHPPRPVAAPREQVPAKSAFCLPEEETLQCLVQVGAGWGPWQKALEETRTPRDRLLAVLDTEGAGRAHSGGK